MKKFYCDICNQEVESVEEYVVPEQKQKYICDKHGNKIRMYNSTEKQKKDICPKCAAIISMFIYSYTPVFSLNDNVFFDIHSTNNSSAKDNTKKNTTKTVSLYRDNFPDESWETICNAFDADKGGSFISFEVDENSISQDV